MPNTVYNNFQKQPLWVADKRVELDGIRLYDGYIVSKIQWYENITGIYISDLVYRLYCDNPPRVQRHCCYKWNYTHVEPREIVVTNCSISR